MFVNHTRRPIPNLFGGLIRENVRPPWLILLLVFVVSLSTRLFCFTGLVGSDDIVYSIYAERIAEGTYRLEPHHTHIALRYGVVVPVVAIYKAFGMHEWSTVMLPLLASSLAPVLAALLGVQLAGATAGWIAGLLLASFPVDVRYATILVPESMLQATILVAAIAYIAAGARQSALLSFTSGILLGLAYLIKEPAVFVVGAFCYIRRRTKVLANRLCSRGRCRHDIGMRTNMVLDGSGRSIVPGPCDGTS